MYLSTCIIQNASALQTKEHPLAHMYAARVSCRASLPGFGSLCCTIVGNRVAHKRIDVVIPNQSARVQRGRPVCDTGVRHRLPNMCVAGVLFVCVRRGHLILILLVFV